MKKAVAVVAYSRFEYFKPVLESLLAQRIDGRPITELYDVHVFQDGLWRGESEANRRGHELIADHLSTLQRPIRIHRQDENLAVARHFDFIERHLFLENDYDVALFFEDDMVLAPGYMEAMDAMAHRFENDPRVGMFSAHPGDPTRPLEEQRANRAKYVSMDHNWGFGLSRDFWRRRQAFVDHYMQWANAVEYRKRPAPEILEWLRASGLNAKVTSQDQVKCCVTAALGAVRIATAVNFGRPIGEVGLHCRPEAFKKMRLDKVVVFDEPLGAVPELDESTFRELLARQAGRFLIDAGAFNRHEWASRLRAGEFDPADRIAHWLKVAASKNAGPRPRDVELTTEADVRACYRLLLGRDAESDEVVRARTGKPVNAVLESFLASREFIEKRRDLAKTFGRACQRWNEAKVEGAAH